MSKYARSVNGVVQEVFTPPNGFSINDCFTPEVVALFRSCPDEVEAGWLYDEASDTYSPPAGAAP